MPDASVSCGASGTGYACSGTDTPTDANSALSCASTAASGGSPYCCFDFNAPADTCQPVSPASFNCDAANNFAYACPNGSPMDTEPSLLCFASTLGDNGEIYCCTHGAPGCTIDQSVAQAGGCDYAFVCIGGATPLQANPSYTCTGPASGPRPGEDQYCCTPRPP